ncbi:MAG: hypothetical protein MJ099_05260, partial [Clostridia bacterium]|nr:hypothetical protein [Clostridia bacterium]
MKKIDDRVNRNYWAIFGIMVVVFTVLYLLLVGSNYTWIDESYTFAMMRHSYREIWKITAASEHPPLYYWYVKTLSAPLHPGFAAAQ